jgi:hypothetical protein
VSKFDQFVEKLDHADLEELRRLQRQQEHAFQCVTEFVEHDLVNSSLLTENGIEVWKQSDCHFLRKYNENIVVVVQNAVLRIFRESEPSDGLAHPMFDHDGTFLTDFEQTFSSMLLQFLQRQKFLGNYNARN